MSSSISSSDRVWRRFFRLGAGTAAVVTGTIYAFVVLVDPFNTLPLSPPFDRAPVSANQRYDYPALARSPLFDSAVFGASTSRLLRPEELNALFQARFANLAMNDATPYETRQLMAVFQRSHAASRRIILGLDVRWCATGAATERFTSRAFPAWMYGPDRWRGYAEMLNLFTVQEAGKEFGVLAKLKREDKGRDGYTVFVPPDETYDRARAAAHLREEGTMLPAGERIGPPDQWSFPELDELRTALNGATETILYFVPYHRVRLPPPGHPAVEVWAECKRRTVSLARGTANILVVDFLRPSPITNDDDNYWDSQHYRVPVATRVARGLAGAARGEPSLDYEILYAPDG
jgi:hypothetical protein